MCAQRRLNVTVPSRALKWLLANLATVPDTNDDDEFVFDSISQNIRTHAEREKQLPATSLIIDAATDMR